MDFFDVINQRYTHKEAFSGEPVPYAHLEAIARAGLAAPSGCNAQSVSLVLIDDAATLDTLRAISATDGLRTAPAAILVLTDPATQPPGMDYLTEDYSAAVENMLLAAVALGYASVWLDCVLIEREHQLAYLRAVGAPETLNAPAILPIGKPAAEGSRRVKKPFEQRMWHGRYGGNS